MMRKFFNYLNVMVNESNVNFSSSRVQILKIEYKYGQYCIPLSQSDCRYFFVLAVSTSYRMVPSTIWPIFFEFPIFCRLISRVLRRVKYKQNMRNEENIGSIVRDSRAITSLSLT